MDDLHIDPSKGLHGAADLPDETIEYLFELMILELAVRTDAEQFEECLRTAIARRADSEDQVRRLRHERDLRRFAAQVMLDIQQLPTTEDAAGNAPGMYL